MKEAVQKIAFSFYPEDLSMLEEIAKDTGMKKTEIMRQLIKKCHRDQKEREIITKESFWDKAQRRKVATSYNVQCEKKDASVHTPASADSTINQEHNTPKENDAIVSDEELKELFADPKEDYKTDQYFIKWAKDSNDTMDENGYARYKGCQEDPDYKYWCKVRNLLPQTYENYHQYNKEYWENKLGEKL